MTTRTGLSLLRDKTKAYQEGKQRSNQEKDNAIKFPIRETEKKKKKRITGDFKSECTIPTLGVT